MNVVTLAAKNLRRNAFRTSFTALGVAIALVAFVLIRTLIGAWTVAAENSAKDRIGTRHKVSFIMTLPKRYIDIVRNTDGVTAATWANWFGAKDPLDPNNIFASMAVDPRSFLEVYDEMVVPEAQKQAWFEDRKGAVLGDVLARKLGKKVGDTVRLEGTIYPGTWDFNVVGIYTASRKSVDRSQFLFHYDYMNETLRPAMRDQIGWIVARVDDAGQAANVAKAIDRTFEVQDVQTLSMSERALNMSFLGMFDTLLKAFDIVSIIILLILALLLGNTIAMGVRERTNEYGALRAIGFLPGHVRTFIVGEALVLGLVAGALGVALSYPIVEWALGRWIEENMGGWFPYFRIPPMAAVAAFVLACVLGVVASLIPAFKASKISVTDALRRLD